MPTTPVELRHVKLRRGLFGYRRHAVDDLVEDVADSFEAAWRERGELEDKVHELEQGVAELKRREELLAQALVAAEQAATEVRAQAKREAELIVAEAHQEARSIVRGAQSEQARFAADARRVEALLRAALGMVEEAAVESRPAEDPAPEAAPAPAAEPVDDTFAASRRRESWPRRDDTREFPRSVPPVEPHGEPEARAG
jgi:cell division initiation protein